MHVNHGLPPLMNVIVFFLRRIFLAYILIYWKNSPLSQIFGLMSSSFAILVYQSHYKPFYNKIDWIFEFYNEMSLLTVSYCLLATHITEHMYEFSGERFKILDNSLLTVIILVIVLNFINYLVSCFRDISRICLKLTNKIQVIWKNLT